MSRHNDYKEDDYNEYGYKSKTKKVHNVVNISYLEADSENIDSLSIRPPQIDDTSSSLKDKGRKGHHHHSSSGSKSTHSGHRYSREHSHHKTHSSDRNRERKKRRKYEDTLDDDKEKKGDLLASRNSKSCKYDAKPTKVIRHSHRNSESSRNIDTSDVNQDLGHFVEDESTLPSSTRMDEKLQDISNCESDDDLEQAFNKRPKLYDSDDEKADSAPEWKQTDGEDKSSDHNVSVCSYDMSEKVYINNGDQSTSILPSIERKNDIEELLNEAEEAAQKELEDERAAAFDGLPPYYPAIEGCRSVHEFQCLNRIEEGTYGVVYRFKDKRTNDIVALKKLKMEKEREGFPITSLREINTLLKSQHPNIVTVREIVVGNNMDKIFIVMDYVEHDLKSLIELMRHRNQKFMPGEVKCLLKQLLAAVAHLHDNWILHRDLKTSNLLLSHKGILKVGDFGLAREYGSPLKPYTPIVVTLWYRAPELLLGAKEYSTSVDVWSVGCIFAELWLMHALFPGKSEIEQINKIFKCLGTPTEKMWPGYNKLPAVQRVKFTHYQVSNLRKKFQMLSNFGLDLLRQLLRFDPLQRITAEEAQQHSYFNEFPAAIDPSQFPKWPAKSELGQRKEISSPKPPSGGGEFKKLESDGDGFKISMDEQVSRMGAGFSLKF